MRRNDLSSHFSEEDIDRMTVLAVDDLTHRLADQVFDVPVPGPRDGSPEPAGGDGAGDPGEAAAGSLARLRILMHLNRAVERQARTEAEQAARAGAGYPQLGDAWYITRQGARRRWPGLVFTATPPVRPIPPQESRNSPMNSLSHSYDVLLVEDDPADALLIEEALQEHGMARSINQAEDGVAALEYLRDAEKPRPDLIVLDLNMPRMNGRELLTVLKDDPQLLTIPVVVLTTSGAPDDVRSAYHQHANAYVIKPLNLDDFIQAVRSIDAFFLETAVKPPRR
ncbi:response regulator [Streptomyces sp. NPDC058391]|uniref:response regulator n=1 Tax=Streptomyces sp. NPDC058391 TaxID=3346476 RepID=UPI003661AF59